jgi:large subunit ribosomal protein L13
MLPHNRMGRSVLKRLKIYPGAEHPHEMQKPEELKLG